MAADQATFSLGIMAEADGSREKRLAKTYVGIFRQGGSFSGNDARAVENARSDQSIRAQSTHITRLMLEELGEKARPSERMRLVGFVKTTLNWPINSTTIFLPLPKKL